MEWQTASKEWIEKLVRHGCNVQQMCSILRCDAIELRRLIHLYWPELPVTNRRAFAPVMRLRLHFILSGPITPVRSRPRKGSTQWSLPQATKKPPW